VEAERQRSDDLREELKRLRRENAELRAERAAAEKRAAAADEPARSPPGPGTAPARRRGASLPKPRRKPSTCGGRSSAGTRSQDERRCSPRRPPRRRQPPPTLPAPRRSRPRDPRLRTTRTPGGACPSDPRKLFKKGRSARPTHEDNVYRGVADHEKGIAKEAMDLLYREGLLMPSPPPPIPTSRCGPTARPRSGHRGRGDRNPGSCASSEAA
jgi:hypothetical protein